MTDSLVLKVLFLFCLSMRSFCDDITNDVFGDSNTQYLPAAFGDFNADKMTDMFVIEKLMNGSYVVKVIMSHSESPFLRPSGPQCLFNRSVKSVVPSDFDGDGAMDILVISFKDGIYDCYVLWGDLKELSCLGEEYISLVSLKSQPLLMDYNGDMISDLFGEGADGNRSFWIFNEGRTKPFRIPMEQSDPSASTTFPPIKKSGGHAFVDIDEDLAADIWVSTETQFEFWPSIDDFQSYEVIEHPKIKKKKAAVIGQSAFCDVDLDGNIEVVLPICADFGCDESFIYVYEFSNLSSSWYDVKLNLKDDNDVQWNFPSEKASYLYTNTITPRVGDLNLDGYPDILITVFNGNTPKVIPLINSKCQTECEYPRTFVPLWDTFKAWPNSVLGTYFDFYEDGTLDVLLVNSSSDGKSYTVGAYKDAVQYDAMFLKVLVLTGVCYNDCPHKEIPYGTNQPGPSITYSMTSAEGGVQKSRATQMTQTGHFALQLPYSMLGLGRNWNFIDELNVGIPSSRLALRPTNDSTITLPPYNDDAFPIDTSSVDTVLTRTFTQIIPNSQLVVIPFPQHRPSLWITKLFITPSKAMIMTAGSLIATCLFVGAIIASLHFREKQQDKKEKRQQAQRFHFDAM
ncbi:UNVERIFIED_CONTAM: hypothetical protein GTU68_049804 [Idotea baltica]|nr:hypothetical protein [Idotea baltica]MCL4121291.1 hypothetical protein [Idotea baltica]